MRIPIPRLLALIAVAAGLALIALLNRTPPEPVPAPTAAAKPPASKAKPRASEGSFPNSGGIAALTVPPLPSLPAPARATEKRIPLPESVQKGLESDTGAVVPTATEVVVPPPPLAPAPVPPPPNSVFGWGPWSGGQTPAGTPTVPTTPDTSTPTVPGFTPTLSVVAPPPSGGGAPGPGPLVAPPPPVVVPPPDLAVRPGLGHGDKNHIHIHQRGPR